MKRIFPFIFVVIVFLAVFFCLRFYFFRGDILRLEKVDQKQIITLTKHHTQQGVYGIDILITGYLKGSATIQRAYEDKKMYAPSTVSGIVFLRFGGDWYNDKCLLIYEPINVKSGNLQIKYNFRTM